MGTQKTRYKLTKKIPTVDVDISLLKSIETYLVSYISTVFGFQETELRNKYFTRIVEIDGEQSLGLIEQYDGSMFPDTTSKIAVGLSFMDFSKEIDLNIRIRFSTEDMFSEIEFELLDINPKEKVIGVVTKLESIINERKNLNFLFHPPLVINVLIGAVGYAIPSLSSVVFSHSEKLGYASLFLGLCIAAYFWLFKKLKPYSSFNTNKQKRNNSIANYLLLGILSFILFSSGLMLVRKYFLGV